MSVIKTEEFIDSVLFYLPEIPGICWRPLIAKHASKILNENIHRGHRGFNPEFAVRQASDPVYVASKCLAWEYIYPALPGIKLPKAMAYHKRLHDLVKARTASKYWGEVCHS